MVKRASSAALATTLLLLAATAHAGPLQVDLAARRARVEEIERKGES